MKLSYISRFTVLERQPLVRNSRRVVGRSWVLVDLLSTVAMKSACLGSVFVLPAIRASSMSYCTGKGTGAKEKISEPANPGQIAED